MRKRILTLGLAFLGLAAADANATPALLRTKNVRCDLSMDGEFVGTIGDSYFIRVNAGAGDHIVTCTGTNDLKLDKAQQSKVVSLPFAISATVSIPDGSAQVIIDLPDPVITIAAAAQILGNGYFYAQVEVLAEWDTAIKSTACYANDYSAAVTDAMAESDEMMKKEKRVVVDGGNDTIDTCGSSHEDCQAAQREHRDALEKASDKVDLARDHFNAAINDKVKFYRALTNGTIAVYPSSTKICGTTRLNTIRFKEQYFLAPPSFLIRSDEGGIFHIK